jgi:hypothetical protein
MSRDDPRRIVPTLHELACLRRDHRSARPLPADLSGRPDIDLVDAVGEFGRWLAQSPGEPKTAKLVGELETLANFYADPSIQRPTFPSSGGSRIRRVSPVCGPVIRLTSSPTAAEPRGKRPPEKKQAPA